MFWRSCILISFFLKFLQGVLTAQPENSVCSKSFSIKPRVQTRASEHSALLRWRKQQIYPWEPIHGSIPRITPYFFMCKGRIDHPHVFSPQGQVIFDCVGHVYHSMFLKEGRAFVYPILLKLLNYVQKELHAPVIITSGNRCVQHNSYISRENTNKKNKYMVGAQVDFYVYGYEEQPERVMEILQKFYVNQASAYSQFYSVQTGMLSPSYKNQEVAIHLFDRTERRNSDNAHSYPYLSIEVLIANGHSVNVNQDWQNGYCFFY